MVLGVVAVVFASAFTTQMVLSGQLPSAYDPGISVDEAFKTSEQPLLIEFYSDTCSACRTVTPLIHSVYNDDYKEKLTMVMVDINEQDGYQVSQLFGVESIPAVFVFDFKHMKKDELDIEKLVSRERLSTALDTALLKAKNSKDPIKKRPFFSKQAEARGVK